MPQAHVPIRITPNLQDLDLNAPPLHLPLIYADLYTEDLFTLIHSHLITANRLPFA